MSIQIVTENTLQNVMHNRNLQKFCMFLLNAYPILGSCTVLCSVTENTRPACALSRIDVKIFTLFVNPCKHFIPGIVGTFNKLCTILSAVAARRLRSARFTCIPPSLGLNLKNRLGEPQRLRKGDSALTPRIAQNNAVLHLTRIVPTKGSWPTCIYLQDCARPQP